MNTQNPIAHSIRKGFVFLVILTAFYIYFYQRTPLPKGWNDAVLNFSIVLSAVACALVATAVWKAFEKDEAPRLIWRAFAWGLWLWAAAELIWATLALFLEDMPEITIADLPWVVAFAPLAFAFLRQFQLIYAPSPRQTRKWVLIAIGGVLIGTTLGTLVLQIGGGKTEQVWYETFLVIFYPFADLALALAALHLSRIFGRGLWGRAWWGLLVFVVSDGLYSLLTFSGIYAQAAERGNLLSLLTDVLYFGAYLLLGLACYTQWLLLKHGPPQVSITPLPSVET